MDSRVASQLALQSARWKPFPTNRKSSMMLSRSSLVNSGDNLHTNNLLQSLSILLFWRSFHSSAWWRSAGGASLNFFRMSMISQPFL